MQNSLRVDHDELYMRLTSFSNYYSLQIIHREQYTVCVLHTKHPKIKYCFCFKGHFNLMINLMIILGRKCSRTLFNHNEYRYKDAKKNNNLNEDQRSNFY